ncbi:MAG: phosphatase PAP2 family protein [Propionibacteriaceae bacterium]|nr:phosphatase PAP2 family protein [Propionibacteriaceae bacterium]
MQEFPNPVVEVLRRVRNYVGTNAAMLLTGAIGAAMFTALLAASADVYDAVADADGVSGLDQPTLEQAVSWRTPTSEFWVTALTNLGDTVPMVIFGLTLTGLLYWRWRRRSVLLLMVVAATGSLIFTAVGKTVVGRNRPPFAYAVPPYEYAPSFPSGHTLNSTVVALMLAYLAAWLARRLWIRILCPLLAVVWAGSIGLSRVFLGHHWLTDVIFGWLFGLAWLALIITIHRILLRLDSRAARAPEVEAPAGKRRDAS